MPAPNRRRLPRALAWGALLIGVGLAIGWGIWLLARDDLRTTPAPPLPAAPATPTATAGHLLIPSVGLNAPLSVMSVVGGVIDPPGLEEAYVLDNHGAFPQGGADGTVFVAMHAVNKGSAPGNAVTDVATGRATVVVGDSVIADGVTYLVDAVDLVLKADATNDDALWDPSIKGRLVVITCLPNPGGGAATRNVVITAHLATN